MLKHRISNSSQPEFHRRSSEPEVEQEIHISPNVARVDDDDSGSSVVYSDSEEETTTADHTAAGSRQNGHPGAAQHLNVASRFEHINATGVNGMNIGPRVVIEAGASVTITMPDHRPVAPQEAAENKVEPNDFSDKMSIWQRIKQLSLRKKAFYGFGLSLLVTTVVVFIVTSSLISQTSNYSVSTSTSTVQSSTTSETEDGSTSIATDSTTTSTDTTTTATNPTTTTKELIYKLHHVTREEWDAKEPTGDQGLLTLPVKNVIMSTTQVNGCQGEVACKSNIKAIQDNQMTKLRKSDITYNLLVSNDAGIYDGRGWDRISECPAGNYVNISLCVSLFGIIKTYSASAKQLTGFQDLMLEGVELGMISEDYEIYGEENFNVTATQLYFQINNWERWRGVIPPA